MDGVVLARLSQVVTIAALLRDGIVTDHLRNLSFKDRTEKKERLYALIHSLKPLDREVISLFLEDLDAKSIAEITGLSSGAIATKVHRIKTLLASRFAAQERT